MVNGPSLTSSTDIIAPKTPVSTGTPCSSQRLGEVVAERLRDLRSGGAGEAGATTLAHVGVQGELTDDQGGPADVEQALVEAAVGVGEDAQSGDFARQRLGLCFGIAVCDADEDE